MELGTRVQILQEDIWISFHTNILQKGMNPPLPHPAEQTQFFSLEKANSEFKNRL